MREGAGVDATVKETLLDQFRCYLDGIDEAPEPTDAPGEAADLFSVFVELAAVRTEVRTESRLVKEALDQFRGVFDTLQSSQATLEQELKRAKAEARERGRTLLRPLLLELLELRDRLAAALRQPTPPARWRDRWRRHSEPEPWREGLGITLRRLDRILADRRVTAIEVTGRRFDPRLARVVGTTRDATVAAGIVAEEVRAGFLWDEELLRAAEVIVNTAEADKEEIMR
jgi:molecular chaperone GrpE